MTKIICNKEYNTDTAELIQKHVCGYWGDPTGYEEILYQTPGGLYFIYVNGGEHSPYPCEDIYRLSRAKVNQWIQSH